MSGTMDYFDYGGNIWAFVKLIVQYVTYLYSTPLFSQVPFICFLDSPFLPPLDHNCQSLWDMDIDLIMFLKVFATTSFRFLNLKMNSNRLRSYLQFFYCSRDQLHWDLNFCTEDCFSKLGSVGRSESLLPFFTTAILKYYSLTWLRAISFS